ncbi:MAG: hypothetical protein AMJ69_12790 [Gammaproteobacteria bacterium SG8_47]|nr:MAG: hypothetical protein AMJ69_12790 [Gammaproteobacteria bacterium SG8_47]
MATRELPVFQDNLDHRYSVVLDGETYILDWHYNARAHRWNLHLADVNGNSIRYGMRLVVGTDLLQRIALASCPPGTLTVVDSTGADTEPDSDTLGNECKVRYVEGA